MMRQPLTSGAGETLLTLWERGLATEPGGRSTALLEEPDLEPPRTLGERTVRLLGLHAALFGTDLDLVSCCPSCRVAASFAARCDALVAQIPPAPADPAHRLEVVDVSIDFRLPNPADVAAASAEPTDAAFARRVLERCILSCTRHGAPVDVSGLPDTALDAVSRRMEALDPGALVSFALECPECSARWDAPLDVGQLLWQKVQAAAERLIVDIDTLARAYGWTERQVMRLSPARRAAYLQLATA